MVVYVSFEVRMHGLWLRDSEAIETLRLRLLEQARRLQAERVRPGHLPEEGDVEVDRVESIGAVPEEPSTADDPGNASS